MNTPPIGNETEVGTTDDERRELVSRCKLVLRDGLAAIRYAAGFRMSGYVLTDEARIQIATLADTMYNIPDWLAGQTAFNDGVPRDIEVAEILVSQLRKLGRGVKFRSTDDKLPARHDWWGRWGAALSGRQGSE